MGAVFDLDIPPNLKLVLLAYADRAWHDGTNVFPSADWIAAKTSYSVRSVKRIARELEQAGLLIPDGRGPRGTRKWRIPIEGGVILTPLFPRRGVTPTSRGAKSNTEGVSSDAEGVTPATPDSLLDSSLDSSEETLSRFSKNDKTPLAQVIAELLRIDNGDRGFYATPTDVFERVYGPLRMRSIEETDGGMLVKLTHPDPDLLSDDRLWRPLDRAFAVVLDDLVEVVITKEDPDAE